MYLASRLTKFDPSDWSGRSTTRSKWWEDFVEGMSMELMEGKNFIEKIDIFF